MYKSNSAWLSGASDQFYTGQDGFSCISAFDEGAIQLETTYDDSSLLLLTFTYVFMNISLRCMICGSHARLGEWERSLKSRSISAIIDYRKRHRIKKENINLLPLRLQIIRILVRSNLVIVRDDL